MNTPVKITEQIEKAKTWKQKRDERPKELSFAYGEQDQLDMLSYAGLEEQAD